MFFSVLLIMYFTFLIAPHLRMIYKLWWLGRELPPLYFLPFSPVLSWISLIYVPTNARGGAAAVAELKPQRIKFCSVCLRCGACQWWLGWRSYLQQDLASEFRAIWLGYEEFTGMLDGGIWSRFCHGRHHSEGKCCTSDNCARLEIHSKSPPLSSRFPGAETKPHK